MDWNLANDDPNPQASWSTRKQQGASQTGEPVAFEWQLDLCNRAHADCWISVPIQMNASDQRQLAELVKAKLDPSLRVYVELSNEVWNGAFKQFSIALRRAEALNVTGGEEWERVARVYVHEAVRLYEQFEGVFGPQSPRLVKVLAGQAAWDGPCKVHMEALQDAEQNPRSTRPTVYAIAPYFGGTTVEALRSDLGKTQEYVRTNAACAKALNLPLVAYEGGADASAAGGETCMALQADPAMEALYRDYLDGLLDAGLKGPFNQYTHVGACWGLKRKTTDAVADSPKYRGVVEWVKAHP
jgi:hypothetical protein